jgi:His-Xaa-Ser system protein HxsD
MSEQALSFDGAAASLDAVQRAAYRLSDRMSCDVVARDQTIEVTVHPSEDDADLGSLLGDFRNEVLDQVLRERIRSETAEVRNLVLALAFSRTGLVGNDAQ